MVLLFYGGGRVILELEDIKLSADELLQDAKKIKLPAGGCKMDRCKGGGEQKWSDICEWRLELAHVILAENILYTCNFEQGKNGGIAFCW